MVYKRVKHFKNNNWHEYIYPTVLIYNYKMVHRSIGMTPVEATKPINNLHVKMMLEKQRKQDREYPDIQIGDEVKICL